MSSPFVWFHHNGRSDGETRSFYEQLLGWRAEGGPAGLTMLLGGSGPFAGLGGQPHGASPEWIPFVAVDDVDAATQRAQALGAKLITEKTRGPAGDFSVVRDPGGAAIALWKKA